MDLRDGLEHLPEIDDPFITLFHAIEDYLFIVDFNGHIIKANRSALEHLGYRESEMAGLSILDVHPPQRRQEAVEVFAALTSGTTDCCRIPLYSKTGKNTPVETRVNLITWQGNPAFMGICKDLTEINRANVRFTKAFAGNPALMAISKMDSGEYVDINHAFLKALGYEREEVIGMTSYDLNLFVNPLDREMTLREMTDKGYCRDREIDVRAKDGRILTGLFSADILESDTHEYILTVMVDITERQRVEKYITENEARWSTALECSGDGVWDWDVASGRVFFSREWKRMLGYKEDEIGDELSEWESRIHSEDREKIVAEVQRHLDGTTPIYETEHRLQTRDGGYKWVLARGRVISWDEQGRPLRAVGTHTDITGIKEFEAELSRTRAQLKAMLDNMPFLAWLKDDEGRYIEVNRLYEKACGFSRAEIIGKTADDIWPPEQVQQFNREDLEVIEMGGPNSLGEQFADLEQDAYYYVYRIPVLNEKGDIIGATGIAWDLSDYYQLERDLIRQKTFTKALIDVVSDFIFYKDYNSRYLGCNKAFAKRFIGLAEEEIIGKTDLELLRERSVAVKCMQNDYQVIATGETQIFEQAIRMADGSISQLETIKTPFYNEKGTVAGLIGIARDITFRKRAEEDLQRRVDHYMAVSELSSEFSFIIKIEEDGTRHEEWISGAVESITGYTVEEITQINRRTYLHPDDVKLVVQSIQRVLSDQPGFHECRIIDKHGKIKWIREYLYPIWNSAAGRVEKLYGIVKDITSEKLAEEAYIISELKFRNLVEKSPLGVCLVEDGLFQYVNPSFLKMTGQGNDEIIGRQGLLALIHPDDRLLLDEAIKSEHPEKRPIRVRALAGDGRILFWEIYVIALLLCDKPAYLFKILDIGERLKAEQDRDNAREMMARAEKVASIATLAASISHEINQPLNHIKLTISGLLYWYQKGKTYTTRQIMERIQEVSDGIDRIDDIIKHVRELVKGEETRQEVCNINESATHALELLERQLASHGITIIKDLHDALPDILAQKTGLEEMVINITVNAMQALDEKTDREKIIRIRTGFDRNSQEVWIEISDNGPGLAPEVLNSIFEPFFSTKLAFHNMGLGLSIVDSLANAYRGRIDVANNSYGGATFKLVFPALKD